MTREEKACAKGWREACDVMLRGLRADAKGIRVQRQKYLANGRYGQAAEEHGALAQIDAMIMDVKCMERDGGPR